MDIPTITRLRIAHDVVPMLMTFASAVLIMIACCGISGISYLVLMWALEAHGWAAAIGWTASLGLVGSIAYAYDAMMRWSVRASLSVEARLERWALQGEEA